jgi:hypothetical protein
MILGRITTGRDDPALRFYRTPWMQRRRMPIAIPQARTFYTTRSFSGLGAFQTKGDLIQPTDLETLGIFQGLQRVLEVASFHAEVVRDLDRLAIDGVIGPETLTRARLINQLMTDQPDVFGLVSTPSINELAPFLTTTKALATSAGFVATVLAVRLGTRANFTPAPKKSLSVELPSPTPAPTQTAEVLPVAVAPSAAPAPPSAKKRIGIGTIAVVGLLGVGLLGTIVYIVRR